MLILTIRTDKPEAEIGLYEDGKQLAYHQWPAHRQLAETLHTEIAKLLSEQNRELKDLQGVAAYKGPGSFTGLRIGLSVANTLAQGLKIPVAGATGDDWIETSLAAIKPGMAPSLVLPEYGAEPHITKPRK